MSPVELPKGFEEHLVAALRNREQLTLVLEGDASEVVELRKQLRARMANLGAELGKPQPCLGVIAELLTGIERLSTSITDDDWRAIQLRRVA